MDGMCGHCRSVQHGHGVIERHFRTLKEQAIHGRVCQTIDEIRDDVRNFVTRVTVVPTFRLPTFLGGGGGTEVAMMG